MSYDYIKAVDEIERLYPPERIAAAKARLAAIWSLQRPPDAIPSIFMGVPMGEGWPQGIGEAACPPDQTLEFRLESIIARAALDDDYVPSLNPGLRQGLIPTAYGAEEFWHEGHFWVKPLVRSAAEFLGLPRPDFTRDGQAAEMLATTRFFRRATEGRLPVQMPDMQGPLDLASHFIGTQRLFEEMADHPDDVHAMLAQLADDFITFMRLQEAAADGDLIPIHCHPVIWIPSGTAMALSEDMLAVISPRLYARFGVPYNERIADAFGRIIIHSCGSFEHNLRLLAGTRGLFGVNFGVSECDPRQVADQFGQRAVLLVHGTPVSCRSLPLLDPIAYVDFIFDFIRERDLRAIVMLAVAPGMTRPDCVELSRLARGRAAWS